MGDVADHIRAFGTTDSYSTQLASIPEVMNPSSCTVAHLPGSCSPNAFIAFQKRVSEEPTKSRHHTSFRESKRAKRGLRSFGNSLAQPLTKVCQTPRVEMTPTSSGNHRISPCRWHGSSESTLATLQPRYVCSSRRLPLRSASQVMS